MGQEPDRIRRDIEATRRRMGRTMDQLEDRLSPRRIARRGTSRVRSRFNDTSQALKENVMGSSEGNPLAAGVIAFGAGMLAAALLPRTRIEEQVVSDVADRLEPPMDEAAVTGREFVEEIRESAERGLERTRETATKAAQEVREEARGAAETVRGEAQTDTHRVRSEAREAAGTVGARAGDAKGEVEQRADAVLDGDGNGHGHQDHARPYEQRTVEELQRIASQRDIPGRSMMNKAQLIEALRR
jgi:hypothetical protein